MSFNEFIVQRHRLEILSMLKQNGLYTLNEEVIKEVLIANGYAITRDRLRTDLDWLDEQDCLLLQKPGGVYIATLTNRGEECSRGLTSVPGIAAPKPGK